MMNPLPYLAQTFSLLVQDEKQREIKPSAQMFMESASLNASSSGKKSMESVAFNTNGSREASPSRSTRPNHSPTRNTNTNFKTNYSQTSSYSGNRPRMICDYCKRPGHIREKCYKLHGYPQSNNNPQGNNNQNFNQNGYRDNNQNSRFNRGKGLMADVHGCSGEENTGGAHTDTGHQLTREQYVQFVELLQQFQTEKDNAKHMDNGSVNFAGMIACTSSIVFGKLSCRCSHNKTDSWILDSGASHHMTFDLTFLTNITYFPCPLLISLPNGYKVKVMKIGSVILALDIVLHEVLYVPSFKYNLISIHCLSKSMPKSVVYFF